MKTNDDKMIRVWRFEDAPKEYANLSGNGGDEDWIAFVPEAFPDQWYISWIEASAFGDVEKHEVPGGTIHIGCHA